MNIETVREYALSKPMTEEGFPFGETTLVIKAGGKMFLLAGLDEVPLRINLKCDPERAIALREEYACVLPGYHMNKQHWNTVILDRTLTDRQVKEMIDHSYELIMQPKSKRKKA
jgi:predicted DNA-binding protein (MmcQ/YjbR family)